MVSALYERAPRSDGRPVANWLFLVCALLFAMVVLGGFTRLTGSGLSIVEWKPVVGALPPLSDAAWQDEFAKYQLSPQGQKVNVGMDLAGFKSIFWLEYLHRLLGRLIGAVFLLPLIYFAVKRRITGGQALGLLGLFALGGLQGAMGWIMVKSGLQDIPQVSHYKLTAHLALALLIYGLMLWVALSFRFGSRRERQPQLAGVRRFARGITALVVVTILSGGLVAGLHAGLAYNTFPLMDGHFVPAAYGLLEPWWRNPLENIAAVQFNHRLLAETVVTLVLALWLYARGKPLPGRARLTLNLAFAMAFVQLGLGIATLLTRVPVSLGGIHQAGAFVLFTLLLCTVHGLTRGGGSRGGDWA